MSPLPAMPLSALNAVVVDLETTSLDPKKAHIVQIGAVKIKNGRVSDDIFSCLVRPGISIPPETTAIHGIDNEAVASSPNFAAVQKEFAQWCGNAMIIGHTIGYDLAVLVTEYKRAGMTFAIPQALDTRLLAQIAAPQLAGYTLDKLASWLGIEIGQRHDAVADARATAAVFLALVSKLKERGIRTVAEAEAACRRLTDAINGQVEAGWVDTSQSTPRPEQPMVRLDSYPYRHRIQSVMAKPPVVILPTTSLSEAIGILAGRKISSVFVNETIEKPIATQTGILTERDIMRALASEGASVLNRSAGDFARKPLSTIPEDAFVYRALGRMSRLAVRHLGVVDEEGVLVGALSARDLLKQRATAAIALGDAIDMADDVTALAAAWGQLSEVGARLRQEDVEATDIAAVISREIGALTRRAAQLSEERLAARGLGVAPCPYVVLVLGSGGRGESLLAADQDNAIIFAEGEPGGENDRWFGELATELAQILDDVGLPFCQGGVMAKNAAWRGSLETWRERISSWVTRSNPQDLLSVDIFFDMRPVYGAGVLSREIWTYAYDKGGEQVAFLKLLADAGSEKGGGLTFFGGLRHENGRFDVKRNLLLPIVSTSRVLAIRFGVRERSTIKRLEGILDKVQGGKHDLAALIPGLKLCLGLLLSQQIKDAESGKGLGSRISIKSISPSDEESLKKLLRICNQLPSLVKDVLF